jgi:hypothetical protein
MKQILTSLIISIAVCANAQTNKISVGILPITSSDGKQYKETVSITEELTDAFVKTKRFIIS